MRTNLGGPIHRHRRTEWGQAELLRLGKEEIPADTGSRAGRGRLACWRRCSLTGGVAGIACPRRARTARRHRPCRTPFGSPCAPDPRNRSHRVARSSAKGARSRKRVGADPAMRLRQVATGEVEPEKTLQQRSSAFTDKLPLWSHRRGTRPMIVEAMSRRALLVRLNP